MIKLLIVEDEKQIRIGLEKTIPWETIDISRVYTAQNAMDGLKLFYKYNPEIVLSDIKLPGMTGLEMCERIRQHNKDTVMFLLSGYMNTQFVRRALTIGISEYFMKPIDVEEIMEKVGAAVKQIKENLEMKMRPDIKNRVSLLYKNNHPVTIEELESVGLDRDASFLICILVQVHADDLEFYENAVQRIIEKEKGFFSAQKISSVYHKRAVDENKVTWVIYTSYRMKECYTYIIRELYAMVELCNQIGTDVCEVVIGVSAANSILDTFCVYEQACVALAYSFFYGSGSVLEYTKVEYGDERRPNLDKIEQELYQLDFKNIVYFSDQLTHIEDMLRYGSPTQIDRIKAMAAWIMVKTGCGTEQLSALFDEKVRYLDVVFEQIYSNCGRAEVREDSGFSGLVYNIKNYIDANYMEDISVEELGQKNGKSANYISYLFKKETGVAIVSYINKLRVEEACKLLCNTELTVYEIAQVVGFKNHNYFAKIFKKFCQMSPTEYRKMKCGKNFR